MIQAGEVEEQRITWQPHGAFETGGVDVMLGRVVEGSGAEEAVLAVTNRAGGHAVETADAGGKDIGEAAVRVDARLRGIQLFLAGLLALRYQRVDHRLAFTIVKLLYLDHLEQVSDAVLDINGYTLGKICAEQPEMDLNVLRHGMRAHLAGSAQARRAAF